MGADLRPRRRGGYLGAERAAAGAGAARAGAAVQEAGRERGRGGVRAAGRLIDRTSQKSRGACPGSFSCRFFTHQNNSLRWSTVNGNVAQSSRPTWHRPRPWRRWCGGQSDAGWDRCAIGRSVLQLVEQIGQFLQPVLHFRLVAQAAGLIDHGQGFDQVLSTFRLRLGALPAVCAPGPPAPAPPRRGPGRDSSRPGASGPD